MKSKYSRLKYKNAEIALAMTSILNDNIGHFYSLIYGIYSTMSVYYLRKTRFAQTVASITIFLNVYKSNADRIVSIKKK